MTDDDAAGDTNTDEPRVSLNALSGVGGGSTMRLPVTIDGVHVVALVDSSSTHNFVHTDLAHRLRLNLEPVREGLRMVVANGDCIVSLGRCRDLPFSIDSELFRINCFAFDLCTVDVILGTEWLQTLGLVLWDFRNMRMAIWHSTREVTFYCLADSGPARCMVIDTTDFMTHLQQEFLGLFTEPSGLPPTLSIDHRIHLKPSTSPVVVRPYRYPQL